MGLGADAPDPAKKGKGKKKGKKGNISGAAVAEDHQSAPQQPIELGCENQKSSGQPTSEQAAPKWSSHRRRVERSPEEKARDLIGHISLAKEEILASDFWKELQRRMQQAEEDSVEATPSAGATWDSVQKLLVIGLGSLEASQPARYQLALALLLAEGFEACEDPLQVHDPVLTGLDKRILKDLDCQVLATDEEAFIRVKQPTLFFLPHCAASMYHNLLAANWEAGCLEKVALLGNSLEAIAERWEGTPAAQRDGKPPPEAVLKLVKARALVDVGVKECGFAVRGAFNDMSVVMFPKLPEGLGEVEPLDLSHLKA